MGAINAIIELSREVCLIFEPWKNEVPSMIWLEADCDSADAACKFGLRGWSLSCYQALRHKNVKVKRCCKKQK